VACRGTFRNWDYPVRRQIFAGFRTARAETGGPASGRPATEPA
jgi:iron(II)-dependent oxidoreductase